MTTRVRSRPGTAPTEPAAAPVVKRRARALNVDAIHRTEAVEVTKKVDGVTTVLKRAEVTDLVPFEGPHATVHVGARATLQIVQYESVGVNVGIWLPCQPTGEDIARAYAEASAWTEEKVRREVALARGEDPDQLYS